ncbi:M1 family metallopeptidase [Kribbella sp. NPDC051770]|uniref:M1 family metallopeptidase n=1 Tax=Kribbella sp. NPDC051770 TaxID=3155413 RepID=UPI00343C2F1B
MWTPVVAVATSLSLFGLGDPVWPELGNGGYDVVRQKLDFGFADDLGTYTASTTLTGQATQRLREFDLDLLGPKVSAVKVNGRAATWKTMPEGELVIKPAAAVGKGQAFVVKVDVRNDLPETTAQSPFPPGLMRIDGWVQTENQPSGARRMLAVADHPAQKAPTDISITGPSRLNSIANGQLVATVKSGARTTRFFHEDRKLATELLQVGLGPFTVLHARGPHGLDLRYAVPTAQRAAIEPQLASFDRSVRFLEQRLGKFPGRRAGAYITPAGGELETQGLTLLNAESMTKEGFEQNGTEAVVLHELAHEWFGNSVSPRQWSDLWLNEGHAVYYQTVFGAEHWGNTTVAEAMRWTYEDKDLDLFSHGPIAQPDPATFPGEQQLLKPYDVAAYQGGALTLYALQQEVGAATFEKIERTWVREHANGLGSTAEYIASASRVAGRDLGPFLRSWLYGTKLPAMPGHPDWKPAH